MCVFAYSTVQVQLKAQKKNISHTISTAFIQLEISKYCHCSNNYLPHVHVQWKKYEQKQCESCFKVMRSICQSRTLAWFPHIYFTGKKLRFKKKCYLYWFLIINQSLTNIRLRGWVARIWFPLLVFLNS